MTDFISEGAVSLKLWLRGWWQKGPVPELVPEIRSVKAQLADLMYTLNAFEARLISASRYKEDSPAADDPAVAPHAEESPDD